MTMGWTRSPNCQARKTSRLSWPARSCAAAGTGESLTVAMLDVDGLRRVNARHGAGRHRGAAPLRQDAALDPASGRRAGPHGPDEFSVLLHATDARNAAIWADRFEDELQAVSFELDAGPVTCSIGMADTTSDISLMEAAARAHRRMEVVQTVRELRRDPRRRRARPRPAPAGVDRFGFQTSADPIAS